MAENVLPDAQFTMAQVLRPFTGFEAVYQGRPLNVPIVFPGTLDPDAGKAGFSPYLLAGLPVPLGAKVMLWFPAVTATIGTPPESVSVDYAYVLHWRLRNTGDITRHVQPAHFPKETPGQPDTWLAPVPPARFIIPSSTETVVFEQTESSLLPGVGNLRPQAIAVPEDSATSSASFGLPLLPPGSPPFANSYPVASSNTVPLGLFSQGVLNPNPNVSDASDLAGFSLFRPYFTVAKGDELLIACVRRQPLPAPPNDIWDFQTFDERFSNLYGTNVAGPTHPIFPDIGVYVFTGTNPT